MFDITAVITASIALMTALATSLLAPWIRGKVDADRWARFISIVEVAVDAAEQLGGAGEQKLRTAIEYVEAAMQARGLYYDATVITGAIEAAVKALRS